MHVYIYIYIYIYIYTHTYNIFVYMHLSLSIYIYIGTTGVSTHGVTAKFMFLDRGTCRLLPLTYFYLPRSAREYRFPQSVKVQNFCSGPVSVDPICPQSSIARLRRRSINDTTSNSNNNNRNTNSNDTNNKT